MKLARQGRGLVPAIGGIAVGHFSIDGQIKAEHYNSSTMHHNVFVAEASDNDSDLPLSLMSELIEFFININEFCPGNLYSLGCLGIALDGCAYAHTNITAIIYCHSPNPLMMSRTVCPLKLSAVQIC